MQMFEFVGKLMGISIRTKALLPFEFAPLVWKMLAREKLTVEDLESVDLQLTQRLRSIAAEIAVGTDPIDDDAAASSTTAVIWLSREPSAGGLLVATSVGSGGGCTSSLN